MGLLDGLLSEVVASATGASGQQPSNPLSAILGGLASGNQNQSGNLLAAAMSLVQQNGGLGGVLDLLRGSGLGAQADSWVGTGANMPVSPAQVQSAFGNSALSGIASQLGLSPGQASSAMAQILPELVNQMTPQGHVPDNHVDLLSQGLALLRGAV